MHALMQSVTQSVTAILYNDGVMFKSCREHQCCLHSAILSLLEGLHKRLPDMLEFTAPLQTP